VITGRPRRETIKLHGTINQASCEDSASLEKFWKKKRMKNPDQFADGKKKYPSRDDTDVKRKTSSNVKIATRWSRQKITA